MCSHLHGTPLPLILRTTFCLIFNGNHLAAQILSTLLMRCREIMMMNAMIAFAKRDAREYPCPLYIRMGAIIEQLPRQQKVMHTGSVLILNSM
jgi:hypothetical protein